MTTTLKLTFLRETTLSRHYQLKPGVAQWIPRSVCPRTLRSATNKPGDVHEVTIEDWWLDKNPWEKKDGVTSRRNAPN